MSLEDSVRLEIEEIHAAFEAWLAGREGASLARAESVLAEGFRLVSPGGVLVEREPLLAGLKGARGKLGADFRIEVRAVDARELGEDLVLATYEEWQDGLGRLGRQSSALLRARSEGGVDWLHVHETWLPEAGPAAC